MLQKVIHRFHGRELPAAIAELACSIVPKRYVDFWCEYNDPGEHDRKRGVGSWCVMASTEDGLLLGAGGLIFSFVTDLTLLVVADLVKKDRAIVNQAWHLNPANREQVLANWRASWRKLESDFYSRREG